MKNEEDEETDHSAEMGECQAFDPTTMEQHTSAVIYGSSFSGKTHVLHWLAYHLRKRYEQVYLFSTTSKLQENAFAYIPEKYKIDSLAVDKIKEIMETQRGLIEDNKRLKKFKQKPRKVPNVLLLFDDVVNEEAIRRSKVISELAIYSRHIFISWIVLSQNCNPANSVPRPVRANAHVIMCNRVRNENDRKILMTEYFSLIDKKEGEALFNRITEPKFQFAVIDLRRQNTRKLTDYIFTFKAPETLPKFKMGSKAWWADGDKVKETFSGGNSTKPLKNEFKNPVLRIKPQITHNVIYNYDDVSLDTNPSKENDELKQDKQTTARSKRFNNEKRVVRKVIYHQ